MLYLRALNDDFLQPVRISVCYWKERGVQHSALAGFPVFISEIPKENTDCYGLPTDEYENCVKVGYSVITVLLQCYYIVVNVYAASHSSHS